MVTDLTNEDLSIFSKKIANSNFYEVGFVRLTPNGPEGIFKSFIPVGSITSTTFQFTFKVNTTQCVSGNCPGTLFLGHNAQINKYVASHPHYMTANRPTTAIRFLIGLEIKATPDQVGPPISLIQVRTKYSGTPWIEHGECK